MGSHFTLTPGFAAMNALMESWSSASSVGDDDHPEMRMSPESAATVALAAALVVGVVVAGVLPHAPITSASKVMTESNALRFNKEKPPACCRRAPHGRLPLRPESYSRDSGDRE